MDQVKIGKLIAECRKKKKLTQLQLAEKLNLTDRAISKWETGKSMPDSSVMLELCDILGISVNDLLSGEIVMMDHYNKELEKNLLDVIKQKEETDRRLLVIEIVLGIVCLIPLLGAIIIASVMPMEEWLQAVIVLTGLVPLLVATPFALKIEQRAGYYMCKHCSHKYVPSYGSVFMAMHAGRTRYMRCPKCHKRSWQKKVIQKD